MTTNFDEELLRIYESWIVAMGGSVPAHARPSNYSLRFLQLLNAITPLLTNLGGGGGLTDPDVQAIADLATTPYGRSLLTLTNANALTDQLTQIEVNQIVMSGGSILGNGISSSAQSLSISYPSSPFRINSVQNRFELNLAPSTPLLLSNGLDIAIASAESAGVMTIVDKLRLDRSPIHYRATGITHTGNTTSTSLLTLTIPGNTLLAGDCLDLTGFFTSDTGGGNANKTFRVTLAGVDIYSNTLSSSTSLELDRIIAVHDTEVRLASALTSSNPVSGNRLTITINRANPLTFQVFGTLSNAAHSISADVLGVTILR